MRTSFKKQFIAAVLVAAVSLTLSPAAKANGLGTKSLASVLTAKSSFDTDGKNFDILTAAVLAVLKAKPNSPVKALTDGSIALTAFIPTDSAFQSLISQLTNKTSLSEAVTFNALHGLGIDTVEQVLLYHVVVGAPILSTVALQANGATLNTALTGKTFGVSVSGTTITLIDQDPLSPNPVVNLSQVDINVGNNQVAHGINAVLLPVALLKPLGTKSLAAVLTAKSSFDNDGKNFDILTAAVLAVLQAKPSSPVKALTDGSIALTAFIPTDSAFQSLVSQLTNKAAAGEEATFQAVAGLGIDTVEQVLLYHVVVGAPILSPAALQANGATLNTALTGKSFVVGVTGTTITLTDQDPVGPNPVVNLSQIDINAGNNQIAHGINAVLLPVALLKPLGTKSLASILTAKNSFDRNNGNFDILTAAVLAVLKAKPNSAVKVLTDGDVALTAFIPNDGAFKNLVRSLTNNSVPSESYAFKVVAGLGIDAVEQILLYHVVPGTPILSETALKANGATLSTALSGKVIKVMVRGNKITLDDYSILRNPKVLLFGVDINRGNKQVAHTIDYVLLPNA